jgi:hypothetical protein
MSHLRQRLLHARVQIGSWIMRPPLERARTYTLLNPVVERDAGDGRDDAA